jgi:hypothetical protein
VVKVVGLTRRCSGRPITRCVLAYPVLRTGATELNSLAVVLSVGFCYRASSTAGAVRRHQRQFSLREWFQLSWSTSALLVPRLNEVRASASHTQSNTRAESVQSGAAALQGIRGGATVGQGTQVTCHLAWPPFDTGHVVHGLSTARFAGRREQTSLNVWVAYIGQAVLPMRVKLR